MNDILQAVEQYKDLILEAERYIWKHPETGYREVKTSKYMETQFRKLGYDNLVMAGDIPGFYTVLDTGREGPEVLILAEMDSIICPTHKEADPETGYVHACGHHVQCATLLGVAGALKNKTVLDRLCGRIRLCVVPAEELIEIEYRNQLREQGIIKYYGGKGEFLSRGYFDGVDIAFMVHTANKLMVRQGSVGCIAKKITFKGRSAHGATAWNGKNALYAATQGLSAVNALRETFQETDIIRFHPIITHGGEVVNAIPEKVTIESYVRGKTFEAMISENRKINQALCGSALSLGCNVEINDDHGYAPLNNDRNLINLVKEASIIALPDENLEVIECMGSGSTDMGELSGLMPVIHPYISGAVGTSHGDNYCISDPYKACVSNAKWQVVMIDMLLGNGAERAKRIIKEFKPKFTNKEEYFTYTNQINSSGDRIVYNADQTVSIKL